MPKLPMYVKRRRYGFQSSPPGKPSLFCADYPAGKAAALYRAAGYAQRGADGSRVNPETGRYVHDPIAAEGVFPLEVKRGERTYRFWVAKAQPKVGRSQQKRFSVGKYGEEKAKAEARKARAAMVKALLGAKSTRRA